ncbi:helix-turn-helix domain-containing protein [Corynebacterium sp. KPL4072]
MLNEGLSYAALARSFNVSRPTLYRALERAERA